LTLNKIHLIYNGLQFHQLHFAKKNDF